MLLILPVGHDREKFRRSPAVTIALFALNVLMFMVTYVTDGTLISRNFETSFERAVAFFAEHPDLELEPEFSKLVNEEHPRLARYDPGVDGELPAAWVRSRTERQRRLNELTGVALEEYQATDLARYGFVASRPSLQTLFAHFFVHSGWMHLLGNMLILYITGPLVEDAWGRSAFAAFYIAGGIIASTPGMVGMADPDVTGVGASGAIAAVMGAFLVRFARARVRFLYFFWVIKVYYGTFWLPAFVVLPAWLLSQFTMVGMPTSVDYQAHIFGFVFGCIVAAVILATGVERRLLADVEVPVELAGQHDLEQARAARRAGKLKVARANLMRAVSASPQNLEVRQELVTTLLDLRDLRAAADHGAQYIDLLVRKGRVEQADRTFDELSVQLPDLRPSAISLLAIAKLADRQGDPSGALELYKIIANLYPTDPVTAKALAAAADIELDLGQPPAAIDLLKRALTIPRIDAQLARELAQHARDVAAEARLPLPELPTFQPEGAAPPVMAQPPAPRRPDDVSRR